MGVTPDGAKMFLGWFDAERQENCSFRLASDGKVRCLPDGPRVVKVAYEDPSCSSMIVMPNLLGDESAPTYALVSTPTGTLWGSQVVAESAVELGPLYTGETGYFIDGGVCSSEAGRLSDFGTYRWFRAAELQPETSSQRQETRE